MKVLFINRPKTSWLGGDYIQMEKTIDELRKLGVEIDISETPLIAPAIKMKEYDIIHLFNFSMKWSKLAIWAAGKWGRKIVVSMIYHESDDFVSYDHQQIMLDHVDRAIFLSKTEIDRVKRHLKIKKEQIQIIPNGIDEMFFMEMNKEKKDIVLTVGRIEESKGQLAVADACQQLGIQYICIGQIIEENYAFQLREKSALIITSIAQNELIPYYAEAKVFALVSRAEIFPLTVMEAMAQGCNAILTSHSEWKPKGVEICDFEDVEAIKRAIVISLKKPYNIEGKELVKKMTWKKVGIRILNIYKKILQ